MAELSYREAVAAGIAQEMRRDPDVLFLGEDVAAAGGVFKTTEGLLDEFGPKRVKDTPISEQAIIGATMGAAMTGLRPIAEIMFSDFFAVCWDLVANQIAKTRYMTDGQCSFPLVIRSANGGGSRFGAQHSQSIENWAMAIPGLKVVAPSTPADVKGLLAASIRDPDPVMFFEDNNLAGTRGEVSEDEDFCIPFGQADIKREGTDVTVVTIAGSLRPALVVADEMESDGISVEVIDPRTIVPLDTKTILDSVEKTGRLVVVDPAHQSCSVASEISSIVSQEGFWSLQAPIQRVTSLDCHFPFSPALEHLVFPNEDKIADAIRTTLE